MADEITIRAIVSEEVRPIRQQILYPGEPPEKSFYSGDDESGTKHFAAFQNEGIVGVVSIYRESPNDSLSGRSWRIRGTATLGEVRGSGIGSDLVSACIRYAESQDAQLIWCDARTEVVEFYASLGFSVQGEKFYLEGMGLRYRMTRTLVEAD